jgi:hypothetical protein
MKQGPWVGWLAALAIALCVAPAAKAQNLGLGAGSRQTDSAQTGRSGWSDDGSGPRRSQMNKRLGLSARRGGTFDPKVYEARGRELQGQFYEIGGPIDPKRQAFPKAPAGAEDAAVQRRGRMQWMIWAGVAGVAGASAGAIGYLLMSKAHPSAPPPNHIFVSDQ